MRIYKRKQERKKKRKKPRSRPRKKERFFLFFLVAFLAESVFSFFLPFSLSRILLVYLWNKISKNFAIFSHSTRVVILLSLFIINHFWGFLKNKCQWSFVSFHCSTMSTSWMAIVSMNAVWNVALQSFVQWNKNFLYF